MSSTSKWPERTFHISKGPLEPSIDMSELHRIHLMDLNAIFSIGKSSVGIGREGPFFVNSEGDKRVAGDLDFCVDLTRLTRRVYLLESRLDILEF